jgi:hypothetical protein
MVYAVLPAGAYRMVDLQHVEITAMRQKRTLRQKSTVQFNYTDGQELHFWKDHEDKVRCIKHDPQSDKQILFVESDMVTQLTWDNFSDAIYDVLGYLKGKQL